LWSTWCAEIDKVFDMRNEKKSAGSRSAADVDLG
jgi:hypothetical protein